MNEQVSFTLRGRNPDVLTCIANLSNDEVFTPPELANRMLDMVAEAWTADHGGASLWADKNVRFLDPFTKSGVFLRESASRVVFVISCGVAIILAHVMCAPISRIGRYLQLPDRSWKTGQTSSFASTKDCQY